MFKVVFLEVVWFFVYVLGKWISLIMVIIVRRDFISIKVFIMILLIMFIFNYFFFF